MTLPISATPDERYIVPGLIRGLEVLRSFTQERREQSIAEVARQVGITRSAAFRIVYTLEVAGFLRRLSESKRYQLTSRVMELGYSYLAGHELTELAAPVLRHLRDATQASVHLAVLEGRNVIYLSRFAGRTSLVSTITVGSRLPAHATAPGRVLLSGMPLSQVVALYDDFAFETYTPSTPDSIASLVALVEKDRRESSVVSFGFYEPDVASIAAPVRNTEAKIVAAISISCPLTTYDKEEFCGRIRPLVEEAALELSRALGHQPA